MKGFVLLVLVLLTPLVAYVSGWLSRPGALYGWLVSLALVLAFTAACGWSWHQPVGEEGDEAEE